MFKNVYVVYLCYIVLALFTSCKIIHSAVNFGNYQIFVNSYFHLINHQNPYLYYHDKLDLFKYSPTYALFMGIFAYFPLSVGIVLFHIFTLSLVFLLLVKLRAINQPILFNLFIIFTSYGNYGASQLNALIAAFTIYVAVNFEEKPLISAIFLAFSTFIKIYGGFILLLLFFINGKKIKFLLYYLISCIVLAILPLTVINLNELITRYYDWYILLKLDNANLGVNLVSLINSLYELNNIYIYIINSIAILVMITIFYANKVADSKHNLKKLYDMLAIFLIWMVLFNHKAEPQTYIIAYVGIALWFFSNRSNRLVNLSLMLLVFIVSILCDVLGHYFNIRHYLVKYSLISIPVYLIWLRIIMQNFSLRTFLKSSNLFKSA